MIKIQVKQFMNANFEHSIKKLTVAQLPSKVAYAVKKITDDIQAQKKLISTEYRALVESYADKSVPTPLDDKEFDIPEDKREEFVAKQEEIGEREVTLDRAALDWGILEVAQMITPDGKQVPMTFSASELRWLEPLFTECAEAKDNVVPMAPPGACI